MERLIGQDSGDRAVVRFTLGDDVIDLEILEIKRSCHDGTAVTVIETESPALRIASAQ